MSQMEMIVNKQTSPAEKKADSDEPECSILQNSCISKFIEAVQAS